MFFLRLKGSQSSVSHLNFCLYRLRVRLRVETDTVEHVHLTKKMWQTERRHERKNIDESVTWSWRHRVYVFGWVWLGYVRVGRSIRHTTNMTAFVGVALGCYSEQPMFPRELVYRGDYCCYCIDIRVYIAKRFATFLGQQ